MKIDLVKRMRFTARSMTSPRSIGSGTAPAGTNSARTPVSTRRPASSVRRLLSEREAPRQ